MAVLPLIRLVVLGKQYRPKSKLLLTDVAGVTTLFSIIVLGVTANLIALIQQYYNETATFSILAITVAALSLVTLSVMLVVDFLRHGAFMSMIVVELGWLFILCVLWVATAGETVSRFNISFPEGCDFRNTLLNGACQQVQVVQAFSFLNFIILLLYTIVLCVMAGIAASRGQDVWLSSVKESFGSSAGPAQHPMTQYN
ncbi:hypothetical protein OG21DRAFT_1429300, partial [Imleria badia]